MSIEVNSFELLKNLHKFNQILQNRSKAMNNREIFIKFIDSLQLSCYRVNAIQNKLKCQVCASELSPNPITLDCSHCLCSQNCMQSLVDSQLSGNLMNYSNLTCTCSAKISRSVIIEAYGGQSNFSKILNDISKKFEPKLQCPICESELPASSFITLECDHRFCVDCIQMSIEILISEGRVGNEIICPMCSKVVDPLIIINLIDEETKEKYDDFLLNSLDAKPGEIYLRCIGRPGVNCKFGTFVSVDREVFECPVCNVKFCPKCKFDLHPKMTCEQKKAMESKDNSMFKEFLDDGTMKICPWCTTPVMKDEKCKYVTCDAGCGGKRFFCWDCQKKLQSKHEPHQCVSKDVISNRIKGFFKGIFRIN